MTLADLGERGFIERIAPGCLVDAERVIVGIGDDCAVIRADADHDRVSLVTTDMLVEQVHFLRDAITPRQLGAKALAVNLSDIAAMGGQPHDAFISLAIPPGLTLEYLDELYAGLKGMAARHGVNISGGDTTAARGDLVINVALTGEAGRRKVLLRSGARPGDRIYVTGNLGDSAAGLHAVLHGHTRDDETAAELVRRHHEPVPHLEQGQRIAATGLAHAMIDLSDGLVADLGHICDQSRVGCALEAAHLPLSPELERYCAAHHLDPIELALAGGEDYVLLFTADPGIIAQIDAVDIGEIVTADSRTMTRNGTGPAPLGHTGWDHLRRW